MIISKTPLRMSFVGGGTDLPSFYKHNDFGAVLSASINSYIYITIKTHTKLFDERIRLNYFDTELVDDIKSIKNTIIKECLNHLNIDDRIYIGTVADVPSATGLGSSSSFAVGLLNALYKYKGINVSKALLAEEAAHIEINVLNKPIGKQDHYAAAFGGLNHFIFNDNDSVTINPIVIKRRIRKNIFNSILTFWTGVSRPAEKILAEQEKNNTTSQKNIDLLMRDQAVDLKNMINNDEFSVTDFGKMIHHGWKMKKSLASNISNSSIDDFYSTGRKLGALGGKISGAGGGGFLSFVVEKENQKEINNAMIKKGLIPYRFDLDNIGTIVMDID